MLTRGLAVLVCGSGAWGQCVPAWSTLGAGVSSDVNGLAVASFGSPGGVPRLFLAGYFWSAGPVPAFRATAWDGREWANLHSGMESPGNLVHCILAWPEGLGGSVAPGIYLGGHIIQAGTTPVKNVARFDGQTWSGVGEGIFPGGVFDIVYTLGRYDDDDEGPIPPALYVGGQFGGAGTLPADGFARWDGINWSVPSPQPSNLSSVRPVVRALAVFDDDGSGPRRPGLYVGGSFHRVGTIASYNIARWDGQAWEGLTVGVTSTVYSMAVFDDDGPGPRPPALFVSGSFSFAGGQTARNIARWDGLNWSGVAGGLGSNARALAVFDDDGPGPNPPALFATGFFGEPGLFVAKWPGFGHAWEPLGSGLAGGLGGSVGYALQVWDEDGPGPNPGGLYVGGHYTIAGGLQAANIARWGCPLPPGGPCYVDCNGDGALNLADLGCFQSRFALGHAYADCNGDGSLNLADFGCFQTKFGLGCP